MVMISNLLCALGETELCATRGPIGEVSIPYQANALCTRRAMLLNSEGGGREWRAAHPDSAHLRKNISSHDKG